MITAALLVALSLSQTSSYVYAPAPPGRKAVVMGPGVMLRWGTPENSLCDQTWDSSLGLITFSCGVRIPSLSVDSLTPGNVSTTQLSAGSANVTGILSAGSLSTGALAASAISTQALTLAPQALPSCASANMGSVAYSAGDGSFYGCGAAGWVALTNPVAKPVLATQQATFTPPTSLGVLGVGNTSSWTVASAGVPLGADCLITCPQSLVGKVVWSCDVPSAGQFRAIGTGTTALSVTLPGGQTCSMRALWLDTSAPALRLPNAVE